MKRVFFLILTVALVMIVGCNKENNDDIVMMTMSTAKSGDVQISMEGVGTINIDWGDGTEIESHVLVPFVDMGGWTTSVRTEFSHSYTDTHTRTIKIIGENITCLECSNNQLTSLDVSKNNALRNLYCDDNQLTSLDVSKNIALFEFFCWNNQLKSLDVSKNTGLAFLQCGNNQLTSLNVSKNTGLRTLQCAINQLTSLDVSNNTALYHLYCYSNHLKSLDMSKNVELCYLQCINNQLDFASLNALFRTLNNNYFDWSKSIYMGSNPGTNTCTQNIAEDKGWTFY